MRPSSQGVTLHTLRKRDLGDVNALLAVVPSLYPGGDRWLRRRLDETIAGHGKTTVVHVDGALAGVAIETPKAPDRVKLSTFYIAPAFRQRRVGATLLHTLTSHWRRAGVASAHITMAAHIEQSLSSLLEGYGFSRAALVPRRYGPDRDEVVYQWKPAQVALFSIATEFATAAYSLRKLHEYRRCRVHMHVGDLVLIYETAPISKVTGAFTVGNIYYGDSSLSCKEPDKTIRARVQEYLSGAKNASALQIVDIHRFPAPRELTTYGVTRAPQAYQYVNSAG